MVTTSAWTCLRNQGARGCASYLDLPRAVDDECCCCYGCCCCCCCCHCCKWSVGWNPPFIKLTTSWPLWKLVANKNRWFHVFLEQKVAFWSPIISSVCCKIIYVILVPLKLHVLRQGFDHDKDPVLFDIELATGLLTAIRNLLRVKLDGLFWLGLPCNSHSFMSTPQHKRSWTNPFGDESFGFVAQGNLIAYRSAILIAIALVRRIGWFLENPGGSRCVCLPVIQQLINHNRLGYDANPMVGVSIEKVH